MKILLQHCQKNEWSCGPACCRALLNLHGFRYPTWEKAAEIAGTDTIKGTSPQGMLCLLNAYTPKPFIPCYILGCAAYVLRECLPCIVNYQMGDDGHYGLVLGLKDKHIVLWEPYYAKSVRYTIKEFVDAWYSKRYGSHWAAYLGD